MFLVKQAKNRIFLNFQVANFSKLTDSMKLKLQTKFPDA